MGKSNAVLSGKFKENDYTNHLRLKMQGWGEWDKRFETWLMEKYFDLFFKARRARWKKQNTVAARLEKQMAAIEPLYMTTEDGLWVIYPGAFGIGEKEVAPNEPPIEPYWSQYLDSESWIRPEWEKFLSQQKRRHSKCKPSV